MHHSQAFFTELPCTFRWALYNVTVRVIFYLQTQDD